MDQATLAKNQVRAKQWRELIQVCQNSGQTVVDWCQQNNINSKTYYYWLRKLRKQELPVPKLPVPVLEEKPVMFKQLEVQSPIPDTQAAVVIHLPNASLEIRNGVNQATVEAVLLALKCLG